MNRTGSVKSRSVLCSLPYDFGKQMGEKSWAIRERLGGSANIMEPFPEKLKGMHIKTYMRMFWEHHEAEMEHLANMREWLDKLEKKVE